MNQTYFVPLKPLEARQENLQDNLLREDQHFDVLELVEPCEDLLHRFRLRLLGHGADADHHLLAAIATGLRGLAELQFALRIISIRWPNFIKEKKNINLLAKARGETIIAYSKSPICGWMPSSENSYVLGLISDHWTLLTKHKISIGIDLWPNSHVSWSICISYQPLSDCCSMLVQTQFVAPYDNYESNSVVYL